MKSRYYTCQFCQKEYEPTRRKVQRFCSDTCRNKNHQHNKVHKRITPTNIMAQESEEKKKTEIEKVSLAGVGNAALGTLTGNALTAIITNIFTTKINKLSTKGDIAELKKLINSRYFIVHNISPDLNGRKAFFDMGSGSIVYYDEFQKRFVLPSFNL